MSLKSMKCKLSGSLGSANPLSDPSWPRSRRAEQILENLFIGWINTRRTGHLVRFINHRQERMKTKDRLSLVEAENTGLSLAWKVPL